MILSNDIKTMVDSPVQSECFQLTHNDLKNYQREIKTHGITNAGLKKRTVESGRICFVYMQRSGFPIRKFDPVATITAWLISCHKRSAQITETYYAKHYKSEKHKSDLGRTNQSTSFYLLQLHTRQSNNPFTLLLVFAFWFRKHTTYYGNFSKSRKTFPPPPI